VDVGCLRTPLKLIRQSSVNTWRIDLKQRQALLTSNTTAEQHRQAKQTARQGKARQGNAVTQGATEEDERRRRFGSGFLLDFLFSSAVSFHSKSISFHFRSFVNLFP
jgi:hypothetical protein